MLRTSSAGGASTAFSESIEGPYSLTAEALRREAMGSLGGGLRSGESRPTGKWLWFRNDYGALPKGREEFDRLPSVAQAKLTTAMKRHIVGESRLLDIDHLGGAIYEICVRVLNTPYCILFIVWGPHRVVLTACKKNQYVTPHQDKELAEQRARRWIELFPDCSAG